MATINIKNGINTFREVKGTFGVFKSKGGYVSFNAERKFYNTNIKYEDFLKQAEIPSGTPIEKLKVVGTIGYVNRNRGSQDNPQWISFVRTLDIEVSIAQ